MKYYKYDIMLVESGVKESKQNYNIKNSDDVARFATEIMNMDKFPEERCCTIMMSTKGEVIGYHEVSKGSISQSLVSVRDIFKSAILHNAHSIIFAHNHPSGYPEPSMEDIQITKKMVEAGQLLEIKVLDHIIIGHDGKFVSMKSEGLM